jgi:hypothetical protein
MSYWELYCNFQRRQDLGGIYLTPTKIFCGQAADFFRWAADLKKAEHALGIRAGTQQAGMRRQASPDKRQVFSTLQICFLFFHKKSICLKVLIPSAVGGDYSPLGCGGQPALG